jgi:hypothetical protein
MTRIVDCGRAYAAAYIAGDARSNWLLPLVCAGNVFLATFAWFVVGSIMR